MKYVHGQNSQENDGFEFRSPKDRELQAQEDAFRSQLCAKCGHKRSAHQDDALECFSCHHPVICTEFVEESMYTAAMKAAWNALVKEAQDADSYEEDLYEADDEEPETYVGESHHTWGEEITLSYHHPLYGPICQSMLEGEWLQSLQDMKRQKMLPEDVLSELERKYKQARNNHYR